MRCRYRQWCVAAAALALFGWSLQLQAEEGGSATQQTEFVIHSEGAPPSSSGQAAGPTARSALPPRPTGSTAGAHGQDASYQGVVPGNDNPPPRARILARTRHNLVTWPGFEVSAQGSRFFVQSTRPISYNRADQPNQVVVVLQNTRIHLRNNRNPLVTAHFATPVAGAKLRRHGRHTHLILDMKVDSQPRIRQTSEGDFHFLFVEFPPGDYPVPTAPAAAQQEEDRAPSYRLSEPDIPGNDSYSNPGDPTP